VDDVRAAREDREEIDVMLDRSTAWTRTDGLDGFASLCCDEPHINLLSDPDSFCLTQRVGAFGPVVVAEVIVGSDVDIHCGELCTAYRINVLRSGHVDSVHRGSSFVGGPGTAAVYQPEGDAGSRWAAGSRLLGVKIDRSVVEDALSDALGRQLTSQIDFTTSMSIDAGAGRSWSNMLSLFAEHLFRPDSVLDHPLVGLPFVDSLVYGLLLAADSPHRDALSNDEQLAAPPVIRAAVEVIEAEAHLPLTVSVIASRCHASVRSLQQGFRRHLNMSPMAYLREVRLRRAHQNLLEADPTTTSVATIAYQWGFTNLGRFAAAHTARYDEPPAATLRRSAFRRSSGVLSCTASHP
jgi:AraC-like DNA-binding protein